MSAAFLFRAVDPWGDEVVLTRARWTKLLAKHAELAAADEAMLVGLIARTIGRPELVYEGLSAPDSKVFYSAQGVIDVRPYTRCRVAVIVRYTNKPASLPSVYLTVRISGRRGKLLYERERP